MKCIHCRTDSRLKERTDGICPNCKRRFVFEPTAGDAFTDQAFMNALDRVSSHGTVKWVPQHLAYELWRSKRGLTLRTWLLIWGAAAVLAAILALAIGILPIAAWVAFFIVSAVSVARNTKRGRTLLSSGAQALIDRWTARNGRPAGLIEPAAQLPPPPAPALARELMAYSFDRAVVCDRRETVDVLLENNFHFENNCAVLSLDGHPHHAFQMVRSMLRRNPRIEVFALHDCTPAGCSIAWQLRHDPEWFANIGSVYDVALRPAQSRAWRRFWLPAAYGGSLVHPSLSDRERRWLSSWQLELFALRPEQLIKRLYRAMNKLPEQGSRGDSGDSGFIVSADASDGGADSFG